MKRAIVLGGGGPVGIAWESGLINGLADRGIDLSQADFIMGTSAGSFVGAQLAMGHDPRALAAPFLAPAQKRESGATGAARAAAPAGPPPDLTALMRMMQEIESGARPAETVRAELGAWALAQKTIDEDAFIHSFGGFLRDLPEDAWPTRDYACTAVDTATGAFQLWNGAARVGLKRAVASSCSVPGVYPPVTINGKRYMDGGMRSATNADLATGYDRVVVVAVRPAASGPVAERMNAGIGRELDVLRAGGAQTLLLAPDEASAAAFGANLMDFRRRPDAAAAGLAQGRAAAPDLRAFWG